MDASTARCPNCRRDLTSCGCPSTERARGHVARILDFLHVSGRLRDEVRLALAVKNVLGLPEHLLAQACAAAIALGDVVAARYLSAHGMSTAATREIEELCAGVVTLISRVKRDCVAERWTDVVAAGTEHQTVRQVLPLQLMFAVALHQVGRTRDAARMLHRLAVVFPFERAVHDTIDVLQQQNADQRKRAERSALAYKWIAGISAIAAAASFTFLRESAETGSPQGGADGLSAVAEADGARLVNLALSGSADSLLALQAELSINGQLTLVLKERLDTLRATTGRRHYVAAQRLLSAGDTVGAVALLSSASAAGPEHYWVDDALYQLMNILEASGRRQESQRVAQRILSEHPQSAFRNSRTLHLSTQASQ